MTRSSKSGPTREPRGCATKRKTGKTRGTTQVFGRNTGESPRQPGKSNGDPYKPICDHLHALLSRKRGYYGCPEEGPLANALGVEEDGIEAWRYQLARIGEKRRRLNGPAGQQTLSIVETLYDIMGHAAVGIACVVAKEKRGKRNEP